MSRKILLFHTLPSKKTINHFSHFQYDIRRTQQKSPSFSKLVTGLSQQQPGINQIREYEKNIHEIHIPTQRKRSEMMKMMVSWNRREEDFEDIVCYVLYLIVGVL